MKGKTFIIIFVLLLLAGMILGIFLNSDYYYSKKLISAIREENIAAVQKIIAKKPSCINKYPSVTSTWWHSAMNWRVFYPLNEACVTGNVELIELLINSGADVNCNDGFTPLSLIYRLKADNWYNISLILIENGASLNYVNENSGGESSILQDIVHIPHGASPNNEEIIKAFNYALDNCDHNNVYWARVLKHSVLNNRIEIVELLLDQKYCDINDVSTGKTALMYAARESTTEMVQLLLDYGADKNILSYDGKTAYDYAVDSKNDEAISVLGN